MTQVYHYHKKTGAYLGESEARMDPRKGTPRVPGSSTLEAPPTPSANEKAVYLNGWLLTPDFIGETWFQPDGTELEFTELGQFPSGGMTKSMPSSEKLRIGKDVKAQELRSLCAKQILGGFTSSALGSPYNYPSGATDQVNLNGVVTESLLNERDPKWQVPFWCEGTTWDRRLHDHTQIRQVGMDGAAHVRAAQDKLKPLLDLVATSATMSELDGIAW